MNGQAAVDAVTTYLRLVEARRLDEAARYLAPEVRITFPGGLRFTSLYDQVLASRGRYREVHKTFAGSDVVEASGGVVVYVFGALDGLDSTGLPFSGIRFIDRFELVDGLIADHRVWNDLGEASGKEVADDG